MKKKISRKRKKFVADMTDFLQPIEDVDFEYEVLNNGFVTVRTINQRKIKGGM